MPVFVDTIMPPLEPSVEKTGLPGRQASRFLPYLRKKGEGKVRTLLPPAGATCPNPLPTSEKRGAAQKRLLQG